MKQFDIPIVIMIFKRKDKIKLIMEVIAKIEPSKVYILADGPRNEEESQAVAQCRIEVENSITWPCTVIKRYNDSNLGVYNNIGEGAKWVFEREKSAIFLEDDNLPEYSFFEYCKNLLHKYKEETRVLWICGTNYLEKYSPADGSDYVFTQHLLPCGWASWSEKFLKYYDGNLEGTKNKEIMADLPKHYQDKRLYKQQLELTLEERNRIDNGERPNSWDYQMEFSIRSNNLVGISPKYNQIKNIGVDADSIHGGTDFNNIMVERFCGIESYALNFPLKHPAEIKIDENYENLVAEIILQPISLRVKKKAAVFVRKIFKIQDGISTLQGIKQFIRGER